MSAASPSNHHFSASPATFQAERLPAAAAGLVERVARTADLVASQPGEKVSVHLDLPDLGALEVQVAMREGRVHASFHSDSSEVRAALASAWGDFLGGHDAAAHAWAGPVFAPLASAPASVPAGQPNFAPSDFSHGGDASPQGRQPAETPFFASAPLADESAPVPAAAVIPHDFASPATSRRLRATA